ncbi:hypothetical protein PtA15_6A748 [Puccinia triticina]|uniref:Uncharacterized protein n=1 Tax=Puccinia triticina TaxID=208348 RepID=A0ABY7CMG5_9BASI|nr:uncharacterized protein PtA15_6A748 [Puccinia triticina]WAQ86118.1 hypothetical protein PtA15_6A748 [Puccinia triticina]
MRLCVEGGFQERIGTLHAATTSPGFILPEGEGNTVISSITPAVYRARTNALQPRPSGCRVARQVLPDGKVQEGRPHTSIRLIAYVPVSKNASRGHNIAVQECGVAHAKSNTCWIIHPWYDSETRPETTQEL